MDIELVKYSNGRREEWDNFVENSNNGTTFHTQRFLSYHGDRFAKQEHHIMFYNKKRLIAVLPMAIFGEDNIMIAKSPYGASFGGIVEQSGSISIDGYFAIFEKLREYLASLGVIELLLHLVPSVYFRKYNALQEFIYFHFDDQSIENRFISSVIDIDSLDENIISSYKTLTRRSIAKAQKEGVHVEMNSKDLESFYDLVKDTMDRHDSKATHSLEELRYLQQECGEDMYFDMAYHDGVPIAGILSIRCNEKALLAFYITFKSGSEKLQGPRLLFHHRIEWARTNGFRYYDFGKAGNKNTTNFGVAKFKETFGSSLYFRDTFRIKI